MEHQLSADLQKVAFSICEPYPNIDVVNLFFYICRLLTGDTKECFQAKNENMSFKDNMLLMCEHLKDKLS